MKKANKIYQIIASRRTRCEEDIINKAISKKKKSITTKKRWKRRKMGIQNLIEKARSR